MFVVDGKISQIRDLDDGKFAYWRGEQIPAAVLTRKELKEVQRLNGRRLLLPYAFLVLGAVLAFLSAKSQLPFIVLVLFSVIAIFICSFSMRRSGRRIEWILNRAPRKHIVETYVPVSTKLALLWRNTSELHLLVATLLTGTIFVSAAFGTIAKAIGLEPYDPSNKLHPVILLLITVVSYFLFAAHIKERRRRRHGAES